MRRDDLRNRSLPALLVMVAALAVIVAVRLVQDPLVGVVRGLEVLARGVDAAATWLLMPAPLREEASRGHT